jgi:hypothetical protein
MRREVEKTCGRNEAGEANPSTGGSPRFWCAEGERKLMRASIVSRISTRRDSRYERMSPTTLETDRATAARSGNRLRSGARALLREAPSAPSEHDTGCPSGPQLSVRFVLRGVSERMERPSRCRQRVRPTPRASAMGRLRGASAPRKPLCCGPPARLLSRGESRIVCLRAGSRRSCVALTRQRPGRAASVWSDLRVGSHRQCSPAALLRPCPRATPARHRLRAASDRSRSGGAALERFLRESHR